MSSIKDFYSKYNKDKEVNTIQFHNDVASYLELILSRNSSSPSIVFNEEIMKEITQPSDYCRPVDNPKEAAYRMLWTFLGRNQLKEASGCLMYILRNYYPNISIIWRAGFHILSQLGTPDQFHEFFEVLMILPVPDINNMVYEYMLYLMSIHEFEKVREVYNLSAVRSKMVFHGKSTVEPRNDISPLLVQITVALSCFIIWKESLKGEKENEVAANDAEIYFKNISVLIDEGEVVDNYLTHYIDLLKHRNKYEEALQILRLYKEKCHNNYNALAYLLKFMTECKEKVKSFCEKEFRIWRIDYVRKMMPIDPYGDSFTIEILKKCADDLRASEELELLADLLFELLEFDQWSNMTWPWTLLLYCVQTLGVCSDIVRKKWTVRKLYWPRMYANCTHNSHIVDLLSFLNKA